MLTFCIVLVYSNKEAGIKTTTIVLIYTKRPMVIICQSDFKSDRLLVI